MKLKSCAMLKQTS